jgi:hypothetical protein
VGSINPPRLLPLDPLALASAPGGLAHLLSALDRRLHVMPTALELAQDPFRSHLALEVLDGAFDPLLADGDF